jgi:hypothetical protein
MVETTLIRPRVGKHIFHIHESLPPPKDLRNVRSSIYFLVYFHSQVYGTNFLPHITNYNSE